MNDLLLQRNRCGTQQDKDVCSTESNFTERQAQGYNFG